MHFLRRLIEWLYYYNRETEAREWLKVAIELYPEKMSFFYGYNPKTKTYHLDDIILDALKDDVQRYAAKSQMLMFGVFMKHLFYLADGDEKRAEKYHNMAKQVHNQYTEKFKNEPDRMSILPFEVFRISCLRGFLMEEDSVVTGALRAKLGLGKDELPEMPQVEGSRPQPGSGQ